MSRLVLFFLLMLPFVFRTENTTPQLNHNLCFTENKGQISDQNFKSRPDILFGGTDGSLTFFLKNAGISYQLQRVDSWKEEPCPDLFPNQQIRNSLIDKKTIYRIDVDWVNANRQAVVKTGETLPGCTNYYLTACPNGALDVKSFKKITYESIYNGIDLQWYEKDGHLKYDYIVATGAKYQQIKLEFKGAQKISINAKGELVVQTPLGEIIEECPYVTQNGKKLNAEWKIQYNSSSFANTYIVSFAILNYDPALPLLIDPGVRQWGTYYGGNADDLCWSSVSDASGNLYVSGYTFSAGGTNIATVGSHQTTHSGGPEDAFVAKFTSAGVRIWGTYCGGSGRDIGFSCALDPLGNIFICGASTGDAGNGIATPGAIQVVHGGGVWDAFLVKFNALGVRQWGTFYGSTSGDFGYGCAVDASGNSYLCGRAGASSGTVFATPGSHQPLYDAFEDGFLAKFDPNGTRLWGTYYGGESTDYSYACATDPSGNVYMVGSATSTINITTAGSHQVAFAGGNFDGFLVKFNGSGIRQWATYYGSPGEDRATNFCRDAITGNLYISGFTDAGSGNSIATDGSHQNLNGGGSFDAFLVQFNSVGIRQWGTFYGGMGEDRGIGCAVNSIGDVYMSGYTGSASGSVIATPGSHQTIFGGGTYDAFLVQFNNAGIRLWGTYYGGPGYDLGEGCSTDNNYNVYLVGLTDAATGNIIATNGSNQSVYGGSTSDGFIVQFYDCSPPPLPANVTTLINKGICTGNSTTLSAISFGTTDWYNVSNGGVSLGAATNYITPTLTTGTYTYYAQANTCTNSAARTPVTVTVHALPIINTISNMSLMCVGQTVSLSAVGANTYTWSSGSFGNVIVVSPTVNSSYTVTGTNTNGCKNFAVITQSVTICTDIISLSGEFETLVINVYPNPTNRFINFELEVMSEASGASATNVEIQIINTLGQVVLNEQIKKTISVINVEHLPKGIYFISITSETKKTVKKFIKELL